jgi:CHAD domain-containing protein
MSPKGPSPLDLAAVIFRRTVRHVRALHGTAPTGWHDTVRTLGRLLARARATSVDAVPCDGALTVAVALPAGELPDIPARLGASVLRATGLVLTLTAGELVTQPPLPRRAPAGDALRGVVRWYLARVDSLHDDAVVDRDPEAVHQMRVALRRLRCVLRVASVDGAPPWGPPCLAYVRALGAAAGAVRDLDVGAELLASLDAPRPAVAAVRDRLAERRPAAVEALRAALDGPTHAQARAALMTSLGSSKSPRGAVRRVARALFERELSGLERALHGDLQRDDGFHDVRKRARRVRDAVDVLGRGLKRDERAWRRRLHGLQAHLGAFNDVSVALRVTTGDDEATRAVRAALERRRVTLLAELATPLALLAGTLDRR